MAATLQEFYPVVDKNTTSIRYRKEEDKLDYKDAQLVNAITDFRNLISATKIRKRSRGSALLQLGETRGAVGGKQGLFICGRFRHEHSSTPVSFF